MQNSPESNDRYFESEEYINWVRMCHNSPRQENIGFWYWDNVELKWLYDEPKRKN